MTVAILIATREGAVLGTDSTTTLTLRQRGADRVVQLFNSAQKVFEVGPVATRFVAGESFAGAVAVYGDGTFGPLSWRCFVSEFYCRRVGPAGGALDLPRELLDFAQAKWAELQRAGKVPPERPIPDAGLLVAAAGKGHYRVHGGRVVIRQASIEPAEVGTIQFGGDATAATRLLYGYDGRLPEALRRAGLDAGKFEQCAGAFRMALNLDYMPLRDAIDFAHFLIYSTIKLHRYRGIAAFVGGPIEIAAVTADRGFRWIVHKPLRESIGIPRGWEQS
jgi:hypothetical protein